MMACDRNINIWQCRKWKRNMKIEENGRKYQSEMTEINENLNEMWKQAEKENDMKWKWEIFENMIENEAEEKICKCQRRREMKWRNISIEEENSNENCICNIIYNRENTSMKKTSMKIMWRNM